MCDKFLLVNSLWFGHTKNIFVYFLGYDLSLITKALVLQFPFIHYYAFMSANSADIDEKLTKNGIPFLVNGTLFLLLKST